MVETLTIPVHTGKPYDISIGAGLLGTDFKGLLETLQQFEGKPKLALITDHTLMALYGDTLPAILHEAGYNLTIITLPTGEATKSFDHFQQVIEQLLEAGLGRSDCILAFGGGVIGDLSGFCAATLKRGMRFIQIPTTLLAQVDSSVGGKTAINSRHGKNLVGAFYQPEAVIIDPLTLTTLPKRELQAGFAEVIKYGLIDDASFFTWLESNAHRLFDQDMAFFTRIIGHSCHAKARIVSEDERETGKRALLNLGHTFGHAVEAVAGYDGRILHGEAVALGCVMALKASASLGLANAHEVDRLRGVLEAADMKTRLAEFNLNTTADALLDAMAQDKKVLNGQMTFILGAIGEAAIYRNIDLSLIRTLLEEEIKG